MRLKTGIARFSRGVLLVISIAATIGAAVTPGGATPGAATTGIGAAATTGAATFRVRVRCEHLLLFRLGADGVTQKTLTELGGDHYLAPAAVPVDSVKFVCWRVPLNLRLIRVGVVHMASLEIKELVPVLTNVSKNAVASVVHTTTVTTQVFFDATLRN